MSGTIELMNSRLSGSEIALSQLAWAKIAERKAPRMLIGGLGMGFTLRAALADLPKDAQITVAELVPQVIAWAKGPLAHLYNGCLGDKRLILRQADVADLLADASLPYDAILMDTDNGPDGLNRDANDSLYSVSGLARMRKAVKHGGVLAVCRPDPISRSPAACAAQASPWKKSKSAPAPPARARGISSGLASRGKQTATFAR